MLHLILTECAKNIRATRHIAYMAFMLVMVIILPAGWGCWYYDIASDSLVKIVEVTLPCLTFLASRTSNTKDEKMFYKALKVLGTKDKPPTVH